VNVPQELLKHKTLMVALVVLGNAAARKLGVEPGMPVAALARQAAVNRTSVYEQLDRLVAALMDLVAAGPGRPPARSHGEAPCGRCQEMALSLRVLEFRLKHPGAVEEHRRHTCYSPPFRLFILDELEAWQGSAASFAAACRLPLDTLKDWVRHDEAGVPVPPQTREWMAMPVDASEVTAAIVRSYAEWEGTARGFLGWAAERFGVAPGQVSRVLHICCQPRRRARRAFRYRRTMFEVSPGAMLVTDGKTLEIYLTGSGTRTHLNWQGMIDQTTKADTAVVVTRTESAPAAGEALRESVHFLGGQAPVALLCDCKPCYDGPELAAEVAAVGSVLVRATIRRPENKADLEGAFSLFDRRVGTIRLDDTTKASLVLSAVREVLRAYTAATNGVPRAELGGMSRERALHTACPSYQQQEADREFIRHLKARHDRQRHSPWRERIKPVSRRLLDRVFTRLGLEHADPYGTLRDYLATFEPAAIRQAAAIVTVRLQRRQVDPRTAHRYLAKVIQSIQEALDLERQEAELLELCRLQSQDWAAEAGVEYEQLLAGCSPQDLVGQLAERAAYGGIPVEGAFWTEKLLAHLAAAPSLAERARRRLVWLKGAPHDRRLSLLDQIAALEWGVA
jgi:hypothetical protein